MKFYASTLDFSKAATITGMLCLNSQFPKILVILVGIIGFIHTCMTVYFFIAVNTAHLMLICSSTMLV